MDNSVCVMPVACAPEHERTLKTFRYMRWKQLTAERLKIYSLLDAIGSSVRQCSRFQYRGLCREVEMVGNQNYWKSKLSRVCTIRVERLGYLKVELMLVIDQCG